MRRRIHSQNRILVLVFLAVLPAWILALAWALETQSIMRWLLLASASLVTVAIAIGIRQRLVYPLRSLANLLEALREGDYSMRGRHADPNDAFGEVIVEVNKLGSTLRAQRLHALEADVLLNKIVSEIDLAVFAFDADGNLSLVNQAGRRLLGLGVNDWQGRNMEEFGFDTLLAQRSGKIMTQVFPGASGRWEVRHRKFRESGVAHELLVISELSHALREEERRAWQRLIRVIGHELNNSLAPVQSIAGTLRDLINKDPRPRDWQEDTTRGLEVIRDRAESLGRFMSTFARLARLPAPKPRAVNFAELVKRAVSLNGSNQVTVYGGPATQIQVDPDQIEQVLINLLKNAVEAAGELGEVQVTWSRQGDWLRAEIVDNGPGLAQTDNLWVPFFTTKPGGTGIGLVLSREIVENHGGSIALENRKNAHGCVATLFLSVHSHERGDIAEVDSRRATPPN